MSRSEGLGAPFLHRPSVEELNKICDNTLVSHLGIEITTLGNDFLRGTMPVDERTRQPYGLLHGGASVALAETLGSIAGNLCLDNSRRLVVGMEISTNHVRSVTRGLVTGTAKPIHIGRSTQVWDIQVEDDQGQLCAASRLTLAVVPKQ